MWCCELAKISKGNLNNQDLTFDLFWTSNLNLFSLKMDSIEKHDELAVDVEMAENKEAQDMLAL